MTYYLLREDELAVTEESTYGTSATGNPAAADFFKHTSTRVGIQPQVEESYRDNEASYGTASVVEMFTGRKKSTVSVEANLIPSGVAATPTAPDMHSFYKALFGREHTCTAHVQTAAGSSGTTLELESGAGVASDLQAGDLIAVDVSSTYGIEVRRVVSIATISDVAASASIGSGANGTVSIAVDAAGAAGNDYTVTVEVAVGSSQSLAASLVGTDLTVTLATDSDGNPDNVANTATLVAGAINTEASGTLTATPSGTGAGWLNDAEAEQSFAGGIDAPAGDTVVLDRALSDDPAAGRDVYVGTTYTLDSATLLTLSLWMFNGDALRYKTPGAVISEGEISVPFGDNVPMGKVKFSGEAKIRETHAVSRPTPTTAGSPLVPSEGKIFINGTIYRMISAMVNVKNGIVLRNNESTGLYPTGAKRTGNNSRFQVEQTLEGYLTSDTVAFDVDTRAALDVIVQLGVTPGKIVAWCTPNFRTKPENKETDGEIGLSLSGRCLGTNGDDEVYLAFI